MSSTTGSRWAGCCRNNRQPLGVDAVEALQRARAGNQLVGPSLTRYQAGYPGRFPWFSVHPGQRLLALDRVFGKVGREPMQSKADVDIVVDPASGPRQELRVKVHQRTG